MTTLIVGGGLSGLALAERLETEGLDYRLVEARDRFGGRILTKWVGDGYFDLGPSWFWPGQPRVAALISRFGLRKFNQHAAGALLYEDESGRVQSGYGFSSMEGSWRLENGISSLANALADQIPAKRRHADAPVTRIEFANGTCRATLTNGLVIEAENVVLAMPPRIAARIQFTPELPSATHQAMLSIPTWMAGQAKALAVYDKPFWREAGLSGDAMSRRGPLVEIHDATPNEVGPHALFGFVGVPPHARTDKQALKDAISAQLVRLFGHVAATPQNILIKDWAAEQFTATEADAAPQYAHPAYGLPPELMNLWNGRLIFAGTEVARTSGGFIEGALEAADTAFDQLGRREADIPKSINASE